MKQERFNMKKTYQKGFALISVLLLATIIFFAGLFLTTAAERHHRQIMYQVKQTEAYYTSTAGFYDAITKLRSGQIAPPFPDNKYSYSITESGKPINITITGPDSEGKYRITAKANY